MCSQILFLFKNNCQSEHIWYKECETIRSFRSAWNQWNKFNNDYQIDDLSRMHVCRTSAINRRHRWTLYRTLMHSVISRRFMVRTPVCSLIHEPFSRAYLRAIIIRRVCESLESQFKKCPALDRTIFDSFVTIYEVIAKESPRANNPDGIIPNKNRAVKGNWQKFILHDIG